MRGIAIIAAAGKGSRAGVDKVWTKIGEKTVLESATAPFLDCPAIDEVVIVVSEARKQEAETLFASCGKPCTVVVGGDTRTQSVRKALDSVSDQGENVIVAVHDGARPFVSGRLVEECMRVAAKSGSAVPALPCVDSLRRMTESGSAAVPRGEILRVQTPQCFGLSSLKRAYAFGEEATDDATLYEKYVGELTLVAGEEENRKITYLSDIYDGLSSRVGVGFDVHPLVKGRALILGGVEIPFEKGLDGHSDADVLTHAIMDALLTAANLPDIGHWFPPSDPTYEGADSMQLLKQVVQMIDKKGYCIANIAATIMAEAPKLAPYLANMESNIAKTAEISEDIVKFAATTTEKLGIVGEGKGIAAEAVALLAKKND